MDKISKSGINILSKRHFQSLRRVFNGRKFSVSGRKTLILAVTLCFLFGFLPFFEPVKMVEAELTQGEIRGLAKELEGKLALLEENSLLPISNPSSPEPQVSRRILMVVTGYSSSPWETDDTPHLTASGTWVRDGVVANNFLPFKTKLKIPELYGDKIFVVEDRMSWTKGNYHIDIWFPSYWEALNFGVKITEIEILGG